MKIEMINKENGRKRHITFDDVLRIFSWEKGFEETSDIGLSELKFRLLDWKVIEYNKFKFQRIF